MANCVARKYKCRATHSHPIQSVLPISKIFLQTLQYWLSLRRLFSPCATEGSSLSMTHFQTMAKTGKIQLVAAEREEVFLLGLPAFRCVLTLFVDIHDCYGLSEEDPKQLGAAVPLLKQVKIRNAMGTDSPASLCSAISSMFPHPETCALRSLDTEGCCVDCFPGHLLSNLHTSSLWHLDSLWGAAQAERKQCPSLCCHVPEGRYPQSVLELSLRDTGDILPCVSFADAPQNPTTTRLLDGLSNTSPLSCSVSRVANRSSSNPSHRCRSENFHIQWMLSFTG